MLDLPYFLQKPGLLKRVPYLYLVSRRSGAAPSELTPEDLVGTVLLLEYHIGHLGTGAYASNDRSGQGTLLAAPADRLGVAELVCEILLKRGTSIAMLSFRAGEEPEPAGKPVALQLPHARLKPTIWALRHRSAPSYLELQPTLDATLARLGQKTRSNMRYYRRRAEKELGCVLVPKVEATEKELLAFSSESMYPVERSTMLWRLQVLKALHDPFLIGLKDAQGRWLSVLAGRRFGDTSEILWQMNRAGYPSHSIGTVMRSYCMEQEIQRGAKRLQVEGGTFHSMHHSFVKETVVDLVVMRSYLRGTLRKVVNHFIPADNHLAEMLKSETLQWQPVQRSVVATAGGAEFHAQSVARAGR